MNYHIGLFEPSNIVKHTDGKFYFLAFSADEYGAQKYGSCLVRQDGPDPGSCPSCWRAWNGNSFSVQFINPYLNSSDPSAHACKPVYTGGHGRMTYSQPLKQYVLVSSGDGTYFTVHTSSDLINWTYQQKLDLTSIGCTKWAAAGSCYYPSLLDPSSPTVDGDRNFQYIVKNTAYLYFVKLIKPDTNRHLVRYQINLDVDQD